MCMSDRQWAVLQLVTAALILFLAATIVNCMPSRAGADMQLKKVTLVVKVAPEVRAEMVPILEEYQENNPEIVLVWPDDADEENYNAAITPEPVYEDNQVQIVDDPGFTLTAGTSRLTLRQPAKYWSPARRGRRRPGPGRSPLVRVCPVPPRLDHERGG